MMLICAWPRAGPTGGAGVALPASICNLTDVCTFFGAICYFLILSSNSFAVSGDWFQITQLPNYSFTKSPVRHFLNLSKLQFHRCRTAKDRHHHLQRLAILVYFIHRAIEVGERPIGN